ncbi:4-coumarate--CoA ligase 1-like [Contarinia nasturtii]|uniref:4-coumarate--CoA ligase 1-like n=1 Tax=Contarinia nasturtii TaxID=265458 RepID=UPI0012D4928E|nr:4-coumarate--CoA ligase 1-like [Contarinia nasturtii]
MAKNSHNVAPIVFASISIGCPVNTLDPTFGKVELIHMLSITKPALMFCDVEAYDLVKECLTEMGNGAKIFTFGGSKDGSKPVEDLLSKTENEDDFVPLNIDGENEIAFIACSSGTTGLSKGVCLSHASLLSVMDRGTSINSSDVILCFSSLYWLSGIVFLFYGTLNGSTRIITTDAYAPELQLRFIEQYKVTVTMNAPHHLTLMLKSAAFAKTDLSSLKRQMTGGSRTPMIVKNEMNSCLPNGRVYVGYGLTEISGIAAIDDPLSKDKDTVGRLNVGIHVKIIDENGKRCGINVNGEICLKTNYKCLGYYENPKATNELFDSEGFILTGDVGHFDEHGYLYIVDRKKEFLKYCNSQISPSEIESFLIGSPHIKSVCVVGVPDDFAGDLPAAVVVKTEGSNITEKDVFDLVSEHYSDIYKLRGGVFFVDSLPATPSGKILRRKAKEIVLSLLSS